MAERITPPPNFSASSVSTQTKDLEPASQGGDIATSTGAGETVKSKITAWVRR